jgi:hypothetical protein
LVEVDQEAGWLEVLWQAKQAIQCALGFKITRAILEEDSRIQYLNKLNAVTKGGY